MSALLSHQYNSSESEKSTLIQDLQNRLRYVKTHLFNLYDEGCFQSDIDCYYDSLSVLDTLDEVLSNPERFDTSDGFWDTLIIQLIKVGNDLERLKANTAILTRTIDILRSQSWVLAGTRAKTEEEIQQEQFGSIGFSTNGFSSLDAQKRFREKFVSSLDLGKPTERRKGLDGIAVLDARIRGTPVPEQDNASLIQALNVARNRGDGALAMQISEALQIKAANDDIYDPKIVTSLNLKDHIENIKPGKPIILDTVEYTKFHILGLKKVHFEGAKGTYYKATVDMGDARREILIREELFVVGDLSRKILGVFDENDKFIPENSSCTIKSIRSTLHNEEKVDKVVENKWSVQNTMKKVRSLFGGIFK